MTIVRIFVFSGIVCLAISAGCSRPPAAATEVKQYPVDSVDHILTRTGVDFDRNVSSDGNGSLRITVTEPTTSGSSKGR